MSREKTGLAGIRKYSAICNKTLKRPGWHRQATNGSLGVEGGKPCFSGKATIHLKDSVAATLDCCIILNTYWNYNISGAFIGTS